MKKAPGNHPGGIVISAENYSLVDSHKRALGFAAFTLQSDHKHNFYFTGSWFKSLEN
jgi:hypothetical protein